MIVTEHLADNPQHTYRIVESQNKFTIEIYDYDYVGHFWWRQKEWGWYKTDRDGHKKTMLSDGWGDWYIPAPDGLTFSTLEEATEQVRIWLKPIKYYYFTQYVEHIGEVEVSDANS